MIKLNIIKNYATHHPNKIALRDEEGELTWRAFAQATEQLLPKIKHYPDMISTKPCLFLAKNSKEIVVLGAALASLNIPFQGLDYHLDLSVIKALINQLEVKHVFITESFNALANSLAEVCTVHLLNEFIETENLVESDKEQETPVFTSYAFTSGTTSLPKIVFRSKSFDKQRFDYFQTLYDFHTNDIHLVILPLYHVSATGWLRLFLNLGCTIVIQDQLPAYKLCEVLHKHAITTTILSPIMLKALVAVIDQTSAKKYFQSLRFVMTGGKNCSIKIKRAAIAKLGPIIHEYYGSTETGVNTLLNSDEALRYPGSVGRVFPGNKIIILDKNNNVLPAGQIGRIAIHSYMNMDHYLYSETEYYTHANDTYLLTADYGYLNHDNYLFIVQRAQVQVNRIYDFYALENVISNLSYVDDVSINWKGPNTIQVNLVPNIYQPFTLIANEIATLSQTFNIKNIKLNVLHTLTYTRTGKINLH